MNKLSEYLRLGKPILAAYDAGGDPITECELRLARRARGPGPARRILRAFATSGGRARRDGRAGPRLLRRQSTNMRKLRANTSQCSAWSRRLRSAVGRASQVRGGRLPPTSAPARAACAPAAKAPRSGRSSSPSRAGRRESVAPGVVELAPQADALLALGLVVLIRPGTSRCTAPCARGCPNGSAGRRARAGS